MDERIGFTGTESLENKITKSSSYNECANFFIVAAVYIFISNYLISAMSSRVSTNKIFSVNVSAFLLVFSLLFLIIAYIFKKRAKKSGEVLAFKLIEACGLLIVLNGVFIAAFNYNNSNYAVLPLFGSLPMMISAAICIFMCGLFLNNKKIKATAFIYSAVALLIISGISFIYYRNTIDYSGTMTAIKLALVAYVILPAAGYLLPGIILKLGKKHNVSETEEEC